MDDFSKRYFDLLNGEYAGINLTRITDENEFYSKQILDSVEPLRQSKIFNESINKSKLHIDVGFGGGFPLLPLAKSLPSIKFIGFEARAKKVRVENSFFKS